MGGLASSRHWNVLPNDPALEARLARSLGVTPLVARIMVARGIEDEDAGRDFLNPSIVRDWADPLLIPGMRKAADRVERALAGGEVIAIFGDYDVDGMSATCLLTLALRELGAEVHPFIPNRFGEGYGLSERALTRVIEGCHPDLLITVDNGIAAAREVEWLLERNVDVVITDHHEPGELVPVGVPVTDPKMSDDCSSRELAGAGVALKLVHELGRRLGCEDIWRRYTEVATLGTVSDMMQLSGENRSLVADGIMHMRQTARPGLVALAAAANVDISSITADALPFSIIPRLNAAGRMGTTDLAFELLMEQDPQRAVDLAAQLEQVNTDRRETESALSEEVLAQVEKTYDGSRVIVAAGEGWHEGVKGIVASRVCNRYHVPAILFSVENGIARGSGRSVGSVDLFHAVERCSDVLVQFGGHAGAVGVTCEEARLQEFAERISAVMSELPLEQFEDRGEVAAIVELGELTEAGIAALDTLAPFGQGNKKPLLAARGVCMRARACVGVAGNHLRFSATDGLVTIPAIMFRTPDIGKAYSCDEAVDLVFEAVNETWQGRTKPKLMVRDILYREAQDEDDTTGDTLADQIFAKADRSLDRDDYAGIDEATSFMTKAVGVTFEGRQRVVASLVQGQRLLVTRDYENQVDEHAVALVTETGMQVGYIRRQIARYLAPAIDEGVHYEASVSDVTGGDDGRSLGVNVCVRREDADGVPVVSQQIEDVRSRLADMPLTQLTDKLRQKMIGDNQLLPAQQAALDNLAAGRSTLCVMATGRGKSLIFHIHAAREAIARGKASVFVFPLRALVADQSFHLEAALGVLGLAVRVLTGETPVEEREEIYAGLASGTVDVLLTTPEYLAIHRDRLAASGRIGFLVVDEAHHAGTAKGGNRSAYTSLPQVLETLGHPVSLAVTATATDEVAREICRLLGIDATDVIVDESVRDNLSLRDLRDLRERDAALVSLVAREEKCVVYVNSREQSVALARHLRKSIPELGSRITFYNAGLSRADRARIEQGFREGELCCIISTSAFGEGVNLPDIRHVVLYHLPFGATEFNQMSGRAGRDGLPACIHLLFSERDARINERIIAGSAPTREELVVVYRTLMTIARRTMAEGVADGSFSLSNAAIAEASLAVDARIALDEHAVSAGISIFRELGFLETSGYGSARCIRMVHSPERMDLSRSTRYLEGLRSRDAFEAFRDWVTSASADEMLRRINRPITPGFGRRV